MPVAASEAFLLALGRPSWQAEGLCRGFGRRFFNTSPRSVAWCRSHCERCPVRGICAIWAVEQSEPLAGVWGGITAAERVVIRRLRQLAPPTAA